MTLEQLIEDVQEATIAWNECHDDCGEKTDVLLETEDTLIKFILAHADTLISWERQYALRTSPFDGDE